VGHSRWLGAGQAAACRRPSRMALSLRIVRSSSRALVASICRSMRGRPSGANMRAISSREKPAAPQRDQREPFQDARVEPATQAPPAGGGEQALLLVEAQRRGRNAGALRHLGYVQVSHP
jgi:hypothetical protein